MAMNFELPLPRLSAGRYSYIDALTDERLFDETGIRIAFTGRSGGVSLGPYASLNLGSAVDDDPDSVAQNRSILQADLGVEDVPCVVPRQVHGDTLVCIDSADPADIAQARVCATQGADGIIVDEENVAALLCFADCVPVIIVSPTRSFAVVHAGWRGVENGIAVKAANALAHRDAQVCDESTISQFNVYIGPHIGPECFETSPDVHGRFVDAFGRVCEYDPRHIDLSAALQVSLEAVGINPERIIDAQCCTVCNNDRYFSYRKQQGICGRQGAFAVRARERS